ncbi:MAG: D-alanine-D-alanine ligase [Parcubacteria group bacterium Gr01-1014_8]|nr:MAG: D-alanine-D-alanine ligase [Parcubacteria group bacterium Gr01-1014_8]
MARTVVGVLRGGTSSEYDLSLRTGAAMLNALSEDEYDVRDILIDKRGVWHSRGRPADPARVLSQVDVVLNGLHGGIGEDGTVGRLLERAGTPYAGSKPLASAFSLSKVRSREILKNAGILMPRGLAFSASMPLNTGEMTELVFAEFGPPYILKPAAEGASTGIKLVYTIIELPEAIGDILDAYGSTIVEEYLAGENATVGVLEDFRGEELYALPPAHIILPDESPFLHFDHHTNGSLRHIAPSNFSDLEKKALVEAAKAAHRALGLSHFSRADFIVTKRGPHLLEVNALPGLYEGSAMPSKLQAVGSSVKQFLEHALHLARK